MFSRSEKTTSALSLTTQIEKAKSVQYTKYFNLPNKQLLFITEDYASNIITLKIYPANDLKQSLYELRINKRVRVLGINQDGSILANSNNELMRISSELTILVSQKWQREDSAGIIDTDRFFVIRKDRESASYSLHIFKMDGAKYAESSVHQLAIKNEKYGSIIDVTALGRDGLYCCHIQGHNTKEFRMLILQVKSDSQEVNELHIIKPRGQYSHDSSTPSGSFIVLPNGNLLTYHKCHDGVQIWDKDTAECINEWNWLEVSNVPKDFQVWCLNIWPFPDSAHLLVYQGNRLYVFNTKQHTLTPILINEKISSYANHHVTEQGTILTFSDNSKKGELKILHYDLPEMNHYRSALVSSRSCLVWAMNKKGIPVELTREMCSYLDSTDHRYLLGEQIADLPQEEPDHPRCLMQ